MRLIIVPSDNSVTIDGERRTVECDSFASLQGVHAVQWLDPAGWIEYINLPVATSADFKPNEAIASIEQFQEVIDAWNAAGPELPPPPPVFQ
jgi:hypothetical protein